jgi:uncharacterized protein YndB with AHSA1/START domain
MKRITLQLASVAFTIGVCGPAFGADSDWAPVANALGRSGTEMPGGVYRVRMADGFSAAGRFLAVEPPHLVVFSWGFADDEAASRTKHERCVPGRLEGHGRPGR